MFHTIHIFYFSALKNRKYQKYLLHSVGSIKQTNLSTSNKTKLRVLNIRSLGWALSVRPGRSFKRDLPTNALESPLPPPFRLFKSFVL
nr:p10 [Sweet potato chlorotic stunt virus]